MKADEQQHAAPPARAGTSARDALLESAARLFGERGPAAVSTREVAAHAGVNSGLIHRHFGTKDELLRQTLERLSNEIAEAVDSEDNEPVELLRFLDAARERSNYWRLLARCLLDGKSIDELQADFPTVRGIVDQVSRVQDEEASSDGADPRLAAAMITAAGLGWLVFEPFLLRAAGLEEENDAELRREAMKLAANMLR